MLFEKDVEGEDVNFFYQVKESVIDFKFYKYIKDNRFAKSFLYMLLLLLVIYSMLTARNFLLVKNIMEQVSYELEASVPDFELKDGRFSFQGDMPYYMSSSTNEVFVIDTTGTVDESVLQNALTGILITEDKLYMKNNMQQQTLNFSDFSETRFGKADLVNLLPKFSWFVLIFMMVGRVYIRRRRASSLCRHIGTDRTDCCLGLQDRPEVQAAVEFQHLCPYPSHDYRFGS